MKLKSLKFILPILLVLPSFAFADWIYQRTPEGTEITSPFSLYFKFDDWASDVCDGAPVCERGGIYWQFILVSYPDFTWYYGEIHNKETKEATDIFDLPVGTKVMHVAIWTLNEDGNLTYEKILEDSSYYVFKIVETSTSPSSGTIGNTQNWLSQNEILAYIGKLAEDIPNYIALMIGLPIAFWFIEKTIAFVRGNFRPVEKIKKE
jgi:hypothetical protein